MSEETVDYELNQTDEYVNHLAEVRDTNPATAEEDIYNDNGVLLLRKGAVISPRIAGILLQHKLKKELDQSIHVANSLTVYDILNQTLEMVEAEPELMLLHQAFDFEVTLRQVLFMKPVPAQILQRLTVMQRVMPRIYQRSIFCGWMVPLLAKMKNMPYRVYFDAFSAGLTHDIGLLHIPVEAATQNEGLSYQQWRALKTHPLVARIILEGRKIYSAEMLAAVEEHHERCDRSGYPARKSGKVLGPLSSLVGMADQLFELYFNESREPRSLLSWHAFLEVNMGTFGVSNVELMLSTLKDPKIAAHIQKELPAVALPKVQHLNQAVGELFALSVDLFDIAANYPRSKIARGISEAITQMRWVRDSAGMGSVHLKEWLEWGLSHKDQIDDAELAEMADLLECLCWRFRHLWRLMVEFSLSEQPSAADKAALKEIYRQMEPMLPKPGLIDPEAPEPEVQTPAMEPMGLAPSAQQSS